MIHFFTNYLSSMDRNLNSGGGKDFLKNLPFLVLKFNILLYTHIVTVN